MGGGMGMMGSGRMMGPMGSGGRMMGPQGMGAIQGGPGQGQFGMSRMPGQMINRPGMPGSGPMMGGNIPMSNPIPTTGMMQNMGGMTPSTLSQNTIPMATTSINMGGTDGGPQQQQQQQLGGPPMTPTNGGGVQNNDTPTPPNPTPPPPNTGKTTPTPAQNKEVNTSTVCRIGQETVEEIVSRTQEVFSILKSLQPPVGSYSAQTQQHDKSTLEKQNRLQDVLKGIGMLFKRLRVCWDKCQENTGGMDFLPIESLIPLKDEHDIGRTELEKK